MYQPCVDLDETSAYVQAIPPPVPMPVYSPVKMPAGSKMVYFDLETTGLGMHTTLSFF